jgi:hypothetical protein
MMPNTPSPNIPKAPPATRRRHDPVLAELWAIKAQINAEAGYDVKQLLANAHQAVLAMKADGRLVTP